MLNYCRLYFDFLFIREMRFPVYFQLITITQVAIFEKDSISLVPSACIHVLPDDFTILGKSLYKFFFYQGAFRITV